MKKIKTFFIKDNLWIYILAFIIPFIIGTLGFYICLKSNVIGNSSILYSDLKAQYVPLFSYLQDIFKDGASIGFSFTKALGGNMIGTIAYYLVSPINILILFVSKANIPIMMLFIVLIKIGLAGLFMYKYLSYINKKHDYRFLIFSTCYALSSYVIYYFFCLMWLDAIYMLPLVCLGIHKIIQGKSPILYIVSLFITILTNYYMGYMVCIFACIYFIYEIINQKKYSSKKEICINIIKFIIPSFLAGMLCMFLLIPTVYDLSTTDRTLGNATSDLFYINSNIEVFISRLLLASQITKKIDDLNAINIYFGIIMLPLIYFYFINKKIDKKEKVFSILVIAFLIISYMVNFINCAWHGFAQPNGFNYRFTYIFIFYFIIMACKSFIHIKNIDKKHYIIFIILFLIIMNIANILLGYNIKYTSFYISTGLLILYLLIIYNLNNEKYDKKMRKELELILTILVYGELLLNIYLSLNTYFEISTKEYKDYIKTFGEVIEEYKPKENEFYRIGEINNFTYNPGLLFNYYGMTNFLSTNNVNVLKFLGNQGYSANTIASMYHDNNNIVADSILGIKYYIANDCGAYEEVDKFEYEKFSGILYGFGKSEFKICENKDALKIGFMTNKNINEYGKNVKTYSNLAISEALLNTMNNQDETFYRLYPYIDNVNNQYKVKIGNQEYFYVTVAPEDTKDDIYIYINDELVSVSPNYPGNIYLIKNEYKDEEVEIRIKFKRKDKTVEMNAYAGFYWEDTEKISKSLKELNNNSLELEIFTDNYIKGIITATKEKSMLFTTIPYDKGWTLYVDGIKTKIDKQLESFIGVELEEGDHVIELKYNIPGIKLGISISGITLLLTITYIFFDDRKRKIAIDSTMNN